MSRRAQRRFERRQLLVVHAHDEQPGHEGSADLTANVRDHFAPWEALPYRETYRHGGVEVSAGCGCAGYYGEGDAEGECEANFKNTSKSSILLIDGESCRGGDSCKDVEKNSSCFGHAFSQPSRSGMFKIEFPLRDGLGSNDATSKVLLNSFRGTQFQVIGMQLEKKEKKKKRKVAMVGLVK